MAILILLAHQNLNYLQGPRILFALSEDGLGSDRATRIGSKGNPVFAPESILSAAAMVAVSIPVYYSLKKYRSRKQNF